MGTYTQLTSKLMQVFELKQGTRIILSPLKVFLEHNYIHHIILAIIISDILVFPQFNFLTA